MRVKKFKGLSSMLAVVFFITVLITSLVINPKETKAAVNRETITILEIEPTNSFKLRRTTVNVNNKTITANVVQMSMPEYISKVEQVNGKYDVVVIGSYSGSYKAPFTSDGPTYLPYGKEVYNGLVDSKKNPILGMKNDSILSKDNNTYVEYYSENDITNKRAKEIKEMIESGQLVYIDNAALVDGTKIKSNFSTYKTSNINDITVTNIVNKYVSTTSKPKYRPILTINTKPTSNRNMNFTYNLNTEDDDPVKVNLYLDLNGDGLFKDKELVKSAIVNPVSGQITNGTISYNLQKEFVGRLDWRLEAVTKNNVKVYEEDFAKYALAGDVPVIRVLQITPPGNILDLSNDPDNNGIKGINSLKNTITDYTIHIDKVSVSDFNNNNGKILVKNGQTTTFMSLNGTYDMVILGFQDSYGSADLNDAAINELKSFINTGQSVMFTHDTLTYRILPDSKIDSQFQGKNSKKMTKSLRDVMGQSRYLDPNNPTNNINNNTSIDVYKKYNVNTGNYEDRNIVHDVLQNPNKFTYGLTDGILKMFINNPNAGSYTSGTESTSVYKMNKGLINEYPFEIGDIGVAKTHYQWYQLNLEDEDVVPWYTLNDNGGGYNKYDARNYYYTYSKGNITYSGTGHSNGFTQLEKELFLNTMVKASRGANHAPTLQIANLDNNTAFSKNQGKIDFTVTPSDIDNDKLTTTITVKNASGTVIGQPIQYLNQTQGVPIPISLVKSAYDFSQIGGSMSIEINTVDPLGARITETRTVRLVNDPTISLSYTTDKTGYIKGDTAAITLTATANSGDLNGTISNIKFTPNTSDKYTVNATQFNYNDVTFDSSNVPDPRTQDRTINAILNDVGNTTVSGTLTYIYNGNTVTIPNYNIPLAVQDGAINISIVDDSGQLVSGGIISVTAPDNKIPSSIAFDGNIKSYTGLTSGNYSLTLQQPFTANGIKYTIVGDTTKSIDLQYQANTPVKNVEFKVTSTNGPELRVTYDKADGYLKGDTEPIGINLEGIPGDSKGKITNIKLELTVKDDSDLSINKKVFTFNDMDFISNSQSIKLTDSFNAEFLKAVDSTSIDGKLSYTLTVGNKVIDMTADYPVDFKVKAGVIKGNIVVEDSSVTNGTPSLSQPAILKLKNSAGTVISTINTSSNSYQFDYTNTTSDIKTGGYTIEVAPIDGYEISPSSAIDVDVNYGNTPVTQNFTFRRVNPTLTHGMYENGQVVTEFGNLSKETYATLGIEASSYGSNPIVELQLDKNLDEIPTSNFKIYNLNDLDAQGKPREVSDASSRITKKTNSNNETVYDISLGNESYKHYIIAYTVKFGDRGSYTNNATISGLNRQIPVNITCGELPDLF